MVFVTAWNGKVYGLRAARREGPLDVRHRRGAGFGVQSSATLTPEGRLLVGDSLGTVHCLVAKTGRAALEGHRRRHRSRRVAHLGLAGGGERSRLRRPRVAQRRSRARRGTSTPSTSRRAPSCGATRPSPSASAATTRTSTCTTRRRLRRRRVRARRRRRRHGDGRRRPERQDGLHGLGRLLHAAVASATRTRCSRSTPPPARRTGSIARDSIEQYHDGHTVLSRLRLPERTAAGRRLRRRGRHPAARPRRRARTARSMPSIP